MSWTVNKPTLWILGAILLHLIANIYTTYLLLKTDQYDKTQKIIQFFILWLIPIVGVFFVSHFLDKNRSDDSGIYHGSPHQLHDGDFGASDGGGGSD